MQPDPNDTVPAELGEGADPVGDLYRAIATPGVAVEVDPDDADQAGAFVEDALSADDAAEAMADARQET